MRSLEQREKAKQRIRTPRGLLRRIYAQQKSNSKTRKHNPPTYNIDDFIEWALNLENFFSIYSAWWLSNYKKELRPSFDRLDNTKGYSFNNRENYCNKSVIQLDLDGNYINDFHSMHEAGRKTGSCFRKISLVCNGYRKTHNKYIWKFKDI